MLARLFVCVLLAVSLVALDAQTGSPPDTPSPIFRGEANYVRVDMYATQNGQPVEDLTAADVEVLEDGLPQAVVAFEHVNVRPAGSQETRIEPNSVTDSRQMAADPRARIFVIFLDTYNTQIEGSANMRKPLVNLLDRLLGPDDLVALMTPEMAGSDIAFGRKTTVISNIMQNEWTWGRRGRLNANDPKEEAYQACYPDAGDSKGIALEMKNRRREKLTLDALEDLVVHLRGVREERKAVIAVSEGWRMSGPNRQLASVIQSQSIPGPQLFGPARSTPGGRGNSGVSMIECEADRVALAMMDNTNRLRELTEVSNRANVTFYPVYPRGLAVFDSPIGPDRPPSLAVDSANLSARQDSLRQLAAETDGLAVIGSNDIDRGMLRIVSDLSSYYLFGYYSTNAKLDGRFRSITVRVKRPGVQVRARRGYRGPTAAELTGVTPSVPDSPASGIASAFGVVAGVSPRSQLRLRTAAWPRTAAGDSTAGSVWIVGELDYGTRKDFAWTSGASADLTLIASTGQEIMSKTLDVDAMLGTFTLQLPESGALPPGEYAVRVRVRSKQNSALPLSDVVRVIVPQAATRVGEAVLWRRGPATGPKFLMTADPRFQRNERVRLEHATTAAGTATARLLDRLGKAMQVPVTISERQDSSGEFRWIVADVVLAPLAPGDYAIEVTLDETRVTAFKVVP